MNERAHRRTLALDPVENARRVGTYKRRTTSPTARLSSSFCEQMAVDQTFLWPEASRTWVQAVAVRLYVCAIRAAGRICPQDKLRVSCVSPSSSCIQQIAGNRAALSGLVHSPVRSRLLQCVLIRTWRHVSCGFRLFAHDFLEEFTAAGVAHAAVECDGAN